MKRILDSTSYRHTLSSIKEAKKSIVLVGGCFDIVHIGHIKFLHQAKKQADILIVLLESDKKVRKLKGNTRPIFTQKERSLHISSLRMVDYVILLPSIEEETQYSTIVKNICPDIIAITELDPKQKEKSEQARLVGAAIYIVPLIKTYSTSKLASLLGIE